MKLNQDLQAAFAGSVTGAFLIAAVTIAWLYSLLTATAPAVVIAGY